MFVDANRALPVKTLGVILHYLFDEFIQFAFGHAIAVPTQFLLPHQVRY